jgi:hypothetical protein
VNISTIKRDKALAEALKQTKLTYQFAAGSYTHSAFVAVLAAIEARQVDPDWIEAVLSWNEVSHV